MFRKIYGSLSTRYNIWNSFGTSFRIRLSGQEINGEKLTGTTSPHPPSSPPPIAIFAMRSKYGWKALVTDRYGIVRRYRTLTALGAVRKGMRIWRGEGYLQGKREV